MHGEAPHVLLALEQSGIAAAIRQSAWAYPAANVGHILALTLFAGSLAVMDVRLLGAFTAGPPAALVTPARRSALCALLLMLLTGSALFAAEASHVALNRVFQIKAGLVALGVLNAVMVARPLRRALLATPAGAPLPGRVRAAAAFSLLIWASVAACGRLIAYF